MKFTIPGEAVGKGRPKFSTRNGFAHAYTPKKTADYENFVKECYKSASSEYSENPLEVRIIAWCGIPKSTTKKNRALMLEGKTKPAKKPDLDNIIKIVLDSLNGIAYKDDSQIVSLIAQKFYAEEARVEVEIIEKDDRKGDK